MTRPGQNALLYCSVAPQLSGVHLVMNPADAAVSGGQIVTFNGPQTITQASAALRAAYTASDSDFAGNPSASFDGDGTTTWNTYPLSLTGLTQVEVFAVLRSANTGSVGGKTGLWTIGSSFAAVHYAWLDGEWYEDTGSTVRRDVGAPGAAVNTTHLLNIASGAGSYNIWRNGSLFFSTSTNTVGVSGAAQFGKSSGNYCYSGKLAYLVLCSQLQSQPQRDAQTAFLKARYGIP